ncbi:hypothetical protein ABIA32_003390 [Streptacidiphilus sp. MAP12-20]
MQQATALARPGAAMVMDLCCGSGTLGRAPADRLGGPGRPVELHVGRGLRLRSPGTREVMITAGQFAAALGAAGRSGAVAPAQRPA